MKGTRMSTRKEKAAFFGFLLLITLFYLCLFRFKSGYYVDELWTYGLANSYYQPFFYEADSYLNKWHDPSYFRDYITVSADTRFSFDSVWYNQAADVHPPLYYSLLHLLSSLFPGIYSKWFALLLNLLFLLCSVGMLYGFWKKLFPEARFFAYVPAILYGLGAAGISTTVYIRMYAALTFFGLCFLYVVYTRLLLHTPDAENPKKEMLRTAVSLIVLTALGQSTQTTFVIFAAFVLGSVCVYLLFQKNIKKILLGCFSAGTGLLLAVLIFPAMLHQIFGGVGADEDAVLLRSQGLPAALRHLRLYYEAVFRNVFADTAPVPVIALVSILFLIIAVATTAMCFKKKSLSATAICFDVTVLLSASCYFIIVAMLNSGIAERYMYMIYPLIILYTAQILYRLFYLTKNRSLSEPVWFLLILVVTVLAGTLQFSRLRSEIVVEGYGDAKQLLQTEYSDTKALYLESTPCVVIEDTELLSSHGPTFTLRVDALTDPDILGKILSELDGEDRFLVYTGLPMDEILQAYLKTFIDADRVELLYHGEHTFLYLLSSSSGR